MYSLNEETRNGRHRSDIYRTLHIHTIKYRCASQQVQNILFEINDTFTISHAHTRNSLLYLTNELGIWICHVCFRWRSFSKWLFFFSCNFRWILTIVSWHRSVVTRRLSHFPQLNELISAHQTIKFRTKKKKTEKIYKNQNKIQQTRSENFERIDANDVRFRFRLNSVPGRCFSLIIKTIINDRMSQPSDFSIRYLKFYIYLLNWHVLRQTALFWW